MHLQYHQVLHTNPDADLAAGSLQLLAAHIVFLPKLYDRKGTGHLLKMCSRNARNCNASEAGRPVPNYIWGILFLYHSIG
jgi:hypothetical protein